MSVPSGAERALYRHEAETMLQHVVTIQRNRSEDADDASGYEAAEQWQPSVTTRGLFYEEVRSVRPNDGGGRTIIARQTLVLPRDTDLTPNDRIASVRDLDGTELLGREGRIAAITRYDTHLAVTLREVNP